MIKQMCNYYNKLKTTLIYILSFIIFIIAGISIYFLSSKLVYAAFSENFSGQNDYPAGSGYYADYEHEIPAITPTAGHGVDCDTSHSQQNSQNADEYFVTPVGVGATDGFKRLHNQAFTWHKIFICPGNYARQGIYSGGDGNEIYIIQSGTDAGADHEYDSTWIAFVWWDDDESSDGQNPYNWNFPSPATEGPGPEIALLPRLEITGNNILFHETVHVGRPSEPGPFYLTKGAGTEHDIIFDRIYSSPTYLSSADDASVIITGAANAYITVQNSVIGPCGYEPAKDNGGVVVQSQHMRVVNNEIFDCTDDISGSCADCTANGVIVENNDLYYTNASYTTLDGAPGVDESPTTPPAGTGDYMCAENAIDLKGANPSDETSANRHRIYHNRLWGSKPGFAAGTACTCGQSGDYGAETLQLFEEQHNVDVVNNIFFDLGTAPISLGNGHQISINGNIFHSITQNDDRVDTATGVCGTTQTPAKHVGSIWEIKSDPLGLNGPEYMLNTWANIHVGDSRAGDATWFYKIQTYNISMEGNFIIDAEDNAGSDPNNGYINNNAFIGTSEWYKSDETQDDYAKTLSTWQATTAFTAGNWIQPTSKTCTSGAQAGCFKYLVTTGGTSGGTQPSWPTVMGGYVTDGSAVYRAALGPYCFLRRGWTSGDTKCLGYVRALSGINFGGIAEGVTFGDRTGYGIDNTGYGPY